MGGEAARVPALARGLGPARALAREVAAIAGVVVAGAEVATAAATREAVGVRAGMTRAEMRRAETRRAETTRGTTRAEKRNPATVIAVVRVRRNPETRTTPKLPAARMLKAKKRRRAKVLRKLIAKIALQTATKHRPRLTATVTMLRGKREETTIARRIKTAGVAGTGRERVTTTDAASVTRTVGKTTDEIARVNAIGAFYVLWC